jgi:antitoxin PrlF
MPRKTKGNMMDCFDEQGLGCCKVEALVSIDERGQMVLPKDVREKVAIKPGDKLAVISFRCGTDATCICLIKADELAGMVKTILGPLMQEVKKD